MERQRRPTYAAEWGDTQAQKCLGVEGIEKRALGWILHFYARLAQLGEHMPYKHRVGGSNPSSCTNGLLHPKQFYVEVRGSL